MASLVIDTHNLVNHLESFGYNKKQAEGFVEALQKLDISSLSTKEDINDVKQDLKDVRLELKAEISELRHEFKNMESRIEAKISEIKYELLKWLIPVIFAQSGFVVALMKLF